MTQDAEIKYFTLEEVKVHDGKQDPKVWFIYKDSVYDVTDYLDDHPGGGDLITEYAGRDATKGFDDFGHSSDAKKQLKCYKIGEIVEEQRKGKKKNPTKVAAGGPTVKTVSPEKPPARSEMFIFAKKTITTYLFGYFVISPLQIDFKKLYLFQLEENPAIHYSV